MQVGGTVYIYVPGTNSWVPASHAEGSELTLERSAGLLHKAGATYWIIGRFASAKDTLYFSTDNGSTWHVAGVFGTPPGKKHILGLVATPSSHVAVVDDSNLLYVSANNFVQIDTERVAELTERLVNDKDTLYLSSVHGNFYRSTDFGKQWQLLYGIHDTATDWHLTLTQKGDLWIISGGEIATKFPYAQTNARLVYSTNRGQTWKSMHVPSGSNLPRIVGIDDDGRIYILLDSTYRSDDFGNTWTKLSIAPYTIWYVAPSGDIYAGALRSTDHGSTWDSVSTNGVECLPFDMLAFGSSQIMSTSNVIVTSQDDGIHWAHYFDLTGFSSARLSLRPDSTQWFMVNTTVRPIPPGFQYLCSANYTPNSGIGAITSHFHVWVAHNGLLTESLDSGCTYFSLPFDTLSPTPILQVMETSNDTVLALSVSGVYRGYDILFAFDTVRLEAAAMPTGAMMKDSAGGIYVAMTDGKLFVTHDGGETWQDFASPSMDSLRPLISLASAPNGIFFAVDSNYTTHLTTTWEYDPSKQAWKNITIGLERFGFQDTAQVSNVWYVHNYAYAGTWNMGLFRSVKPVAGPSGVEVSVPVSTFEIFPNPASRFVEITDLPAPNGAIVLLDLLGRTALRGTLDARGAAMLDVSKLLRGVYEVVAEQGRSTTRIGKLVVDPE